jgi:transcriptional regulator with XRE-family HTH domain
MTLSEAIRELRRASGDKSQQVLATELGIATKTLQLYEKGRTLPEPKNLLALAAYADRLDRDDLYVVFLGDTLMDQLTPPPGYEVYLHFGPARSPAGRERTITKRRKR